MTNNIKLPPLPEGNVAHLIAAQAAEIEALRAEVEQLKNYALQIERYVLRNAPPEIGFLKDDSQ